MEPRAPVYERVPDLDRERAGSRATFDRQQSARTDEVENMPVVALPEGHQDIHPDSHPVSHTGRWAIVSTSAGGACRSYQQTRGSSSSGRDRSPDLCDCTDASTRRGLSRAC